MNTTTPTLLLASLMLGTLLTQCSLLPPNVQVAPPTEPPYSELSSGRRKLFVFMDGTNNQWSNRTNVRRLFEMLSAREDPSLACCYISGVGVGGGIFGSGLGKGMKSRMGKGYAFLSRHYRPGDEIYIFGFSRGSLQARALAGMIAYSGLLPESLATSESEAEKNAGRVWEYCRFIEEDLSHENNADKVLNATSWSQAVARRTPPVPLFMDGSGKGVQGRYAEVKFLGVWDTVPGSQFKEYGQFREADNDDRDGTRYKISAYPPIRQIAHAMSIDEHRSQFKPVQVARPKSPSRTKLEEVWFPGVHSDVGGGYDDANGLSGLSMNWMIERLNAAAHLRYPLPKVHEDALAPQHESLDDWPGNLFSDPIVRSIPNDADLHLSAVKARHAASRLYVRRHGKFVDLKEGYAPESLKGHKSHVLK